MSAKEGRRAGPEVLFLILEELRSLNGARPEFGT